jgi:iron complex outermembrane receptor protein
MMNARKLMLGVAVSAIAFGASGMAQAQEADTSGQGLAEIVVTAQKRETKLETTPATINVVGGEQLANMGVVEIKGLAANVPGFTMHESPGGLSGVSLRGVGTSAGSQVFEQSVGLFVDGIYHPRARQYRDALFDVERVEVVKGSQGVLFGKNTSVGAVSVISRGPGEQTGGYVQGQIEANYGSYAFEGAVDFVASDTFKLRIAGLYDKQKGYIENVSKTRDEPSGDRHVIRAVAEWDPSDTISVRAKSQFSKLDFLGNNFEFIANQNVAGLQALGVVDGGLANYVKYEDAGTAGIINDIQKSQDHALEVNIDLGGDYTLTSATGYSKFDFVNGFDSDSTPTVFLFSQFNEGFDQFSQEVRLTSPAGRPIEFIVGAFYLNSETNYNYYTYYNGFPVLGGLYGTVRQDFNQKENTFAGFGQATWHIADDVQFLLGGRLTTDKKNADFQKFLVDDLGRPAGLVALVGNGPFHAVSVRDTTFDFSGTLSYNPTESSTLYISAGQGNKGSGFVNQAALAAPFPSTFLVPVERVRTVEAGVKGRFLDGRAYVSLAAYHLDIKDYQDSFYNSTARAFQVRSLDAKSTGIEAEGQFQLARGLTAYGNFAWNPSAKLDNGERMQRSPRFTSTLGMRFNVPLSDDVKLSGFGQYLHSSTMLHQPASAPGDNTSHPYDLVSARVELEYVPLGLSFFINGQNLTKDVYRTFSFGSPVGLGQVGALNEPRTIVFGLRKTF